MAPPGNKIFVAFTQFELEEFNEESDDRTSNGCSFDYLQIVQKKAGDKDVIETQNYCGGMPKEFTSIGDTVVFK